MLVVMCFQQSCASKSREELQVVPSKRLSALPECRFIFVVNNVCSCLDCISPGNRFAFCFKSGLPCHATFDNLPSEWRFRSDQLHKVSNKSLGRQMNQKHLYYIFIPRRRESWGSPASDRSAKQSGTVRLCHTDIKATIWQDLCCAGSDAKQ